MAMQSFPGIQPLVVIVEDKRAIAEAVETHLHNANIKVIIADGCDQAMQVLTQHQLDLILIDTDLDDGCGYELCRTIRSGGADGMLAQLVDVPIVMMSKRADEQSRLEAFRAGADDFTVRPFSLAELVYRVQAIIRRSRGISSAQIMIGSLRIDPRRREVLVGDQSVDLTPKTFDLLQLLARNAGRVFSREELLKRIWGYSYVDNTRTVDVHVNRLRQKLAECEIPATMITTEWGIGYKFVSPAA
ncbi:MAG: response regulator transcription factor [Chloroflexales bacterium]|nr:response regulator transcription factor [Chloroflexales bacterium]